MDEPLAKTNLTGGANYFYHSDALGSTTAITDPSGNVVESYRYTSYGIPVIYDKDGLEISKSAIGNFYLHTGQDRVAHFDQNAGWGEHMPWGSDPDDPSKHVSEYRSSYKWTKDYFKRFKDEVEKRKQRKRDGDC